MSLFPSVCVEINELCKSHWGLGGEEHTLICVIKAVTLAFADAGFSAADREASLELIKLDISRTFPNLCIFQQVSNVNFCLDFS